MKIKKINFLLMLLFSCVILVGRVYAPPNDILSEKEVEILRNIVNDQFISHTPESIDLYMQALKIIEANYTAISQSNIDSMVIELANTILFRAIPIELKSFEQSSHAFFVKAVEIIKNSNNPKLIRKFNLKLSLEKIYNFSAPAQMATIQNLLSDNDFDINNHLLEHLIYNGKKKSSSRSS